MIIMAIDLGTVRTGISLCDKYEILAYPLTTIHEKDYNKLALKIKDLTTEHKVEQIILGLPKNMDGSIGKSGKRANDFLKILKKMLNIDIVLWDERFTTVIAEQFLKNNSIKKRKHKNIIDTFSASIILQNFLDFKLKNSKK